MKNSIIIKSFPNGISLYMDPDMEFFELLKEIKVKFQQSEKFFKDAKVAISFDGRKLLPQEEKSIIDTIMEHSSITILCIVDKCESENKPYYNAIRRLGLDEKFNTCSFYGNDLQDGETLDAVKDLIIFGNVSENALVRAGGSVYIIGSLLGKVKAGETEDANSIVFVLNLVSEQVQICGKRFKVQKTNSFFKKKKEPTQILKIQNGKVVAEPFEIGNKVLYEKKI